VCKCVSIIQLHGLPNPMLFVLIAQEMNFIVMLIIIYGTGDPVIWQKYRCARNKANRLLRNAKHTYISQLVSFAPDGSVGFGPFFCYNHYLHVIQRVTTMNFTPNDFNHH